MKGIIFNILEQFVCEGWGEDTYEEILAACPLHTKEPFVGPGTYPDSDLLAIVGKTVERLNIPLPDALEAFGKFCFPRLAARYPHFMTPHKHPKPFLFTLESVVHTEVRKVFPGAEPPRFNCMDTGPTELVMEYGSRRKLCPLARGLIAGVAAYYNHPIVTTETACAQSGAAVCEFHLQFASPA